MSYSYLLDLYRDFVERKNTLQSRSENDGISEENKMYLQGQISALEELLEFLKENYHQKLPRRLQK